MLYKKNSNHELDTALFKNPTSEYRGTPFWSWNCKLNKEQLTEQIEVLKEMGFGGFHMHSRTGMATPYLSDEFMDMVRTCVDKAKAEEMLAWLYDEDRWPSGAAGGIVTKDPKYRARYILFTVNPRECMPKEQAFETGGIYFVAKFHVILDENGDLVSYKRYKEDQTLEINEGRIWYVYCCTNQKNPWYNNETYVDTMSKEAIERFVEVTHQRYKEVVGDEFSNVVPAIFTDEPQFHSKGRLGYADGTEDITLPWTYLFPQLYFSKYGESIEDLLPELIWNLPEGVSLSRYRYHDLTGECFAKAFADTVGDWCKENNIALTGHMMAEYTLNSQTLHTGGVMRSYRSFQIPGIDILCDYYEYTTAKQAQSAANQFGYEGVLSELYGVTNWDFDFRGHKTQGDWQAALGVTVRVPHLSWVSMEGNAKRDYPASISYQSPWYKEYKYVEDHFARVNTALVRGTPLARVAVIHPIESAWLFWGPSQSSMGKLMKLENNFINITNWLITGTIDFDFVDESLLPMQYKSTSSGFSIGKMNYQVVIVPECITLRSTTIAALEEFRRKGGKLIFLGKCPSYVDALPDNKNVLLKLYEESERINFDKDEILNSLDNVRDVEIRNSDGVLTDNLLTRMRVDNNCQWLFIAHAKAPDYKDIPHLQQIDIYVKGQFTPLLYDTLKGEIKEIPYQIVNLKKGVFTLIKARIFDHDSLLLQLNPFKDEIPQKGICDPYWIEGKKLIQKIDIKDKVHYTREEPNTLLLDIAKYSFDDGKMMPEEELLRIDTIIRHNLLWPQRASAVAQPWVEPAEKVFNHKLKMVFTFYSEIDYKDPLLACETPQDYVAVFNGINVKMDVKGYFTDKSIKTVVLPPIKKGENILELSIPFGKSTNIEWSYILGDFNVRLEGCRKTITAKTNTIGFGSITNQGMPFYGGNISYNFDFVSNNTGPADVFIKATNYRGSVIKVEVDGKPQGYLCYSPYVVKLSDIEPGRHNVKMTLFGNRHNSFAPLHFADLSARWISPDAWRIQGDAWTYNYMLKDMGILTSPVIEIFE